MITHDYKTQHLNRDTLAVFLVALCGRLPSLGAWWHGADWELLSRAAGVTARGEFAAHWLSRDLIWRLMWPLAGLEPDPSSWLRLLLHGAVAAGTVHLAARLNYGPWARLLAGLLVAVTPLAFRPLLNAGGLMILLPTALGLWAIIWGLRGRGASAVIALIAGAAAVLAGEAAWGLPLLAIWLAVDRFRNDEDGRFALMAGLLLTLCVGFAVTLVVRQLAPSDGWSAELASLGTASTNLARAPLWMLTPLPIHAESVHPAIALVGLSVWVLWFVVARRIAIDRDRRPMVLMVTALLALAPALPWRTLGTPGSCYAAWIPAALMLAPLLTSRAVRGPRLPVLLLAVAITGAVAWGGTAYGLKQRRGDGRPADPVVRATAISYEASRRLRDLPDVVKQVVILQPGPGEKTPLRNALGHGSATKLLLPEGPAVRWASDLDDLVSRDHVLVDAGTQLKIWGTPVQARLLLVLTRIGQGRQQEATDLLYNTLADSRRTIPLFYSEDQLTIPSSRIRDNIPEFLEAIDRYETPSGETANLRGVAQEFLRRSGLLAEADAQDQR